MAAIEGRVVVLALRVAQAILAIIVLGLTSYGIDRKASARTIYPY